MRDALRAHDTGAPVFLDTGSLGGETTLDDLLDTGIKELKYMKAHTSPRKARGASMGAKFRNFRRETLDMRWDDGSISGKEYIVAIACGWIGQDLDRERAPPRAGCPTTATPSSSC